MKINATTNSVKYGVVIASVLSIIVLAQAYSHYPPGQENIPQNQLTLLYGYNNGEKAPTCPPNQVGTGIQFGRGYVDDYGNPASDDIMIVCQPMSTFGITSLGNAVPADLVLNSNGEAFKDQICEGKAMTATHMYEGTYVYGGYGMYIPVGYTAADSLAYVDAGCSSFTGAGLVYPPYWRTADKYIPQGAYMNYGTWRLECGSGEMLVGFGYPWTEWDPQMPESSRFGIRCQRVTPNPVVPQVELYFSGE